MVMMYAWNVTFPSYMIGSLKSHTLFSLGFRVCIMSQNLGQTSLRSCLRRRFLAGILQYSIRLCNPLDAPMLHNMSQVAPASVAATSSCSATSGHRAKDLQSRRKRHTQPWTLRVPTCQRHLIAYYDARASMMLNRSSEHNIFQFLRVDGFCSEG